MTANEIIAMLARMDTPTDGVTDQDQADEIMADLDDERLCSDASALYELIREARKITACQEPPKAWADAKQEIDAGWPEER